MNSSAFFSPRGRLALLMFVLVAALCAGAGAFAQAAPGDPPGRVAQLNYFDGPVSFAPAGFDQWAGAVLNRPLTQGDRLWNDAGARSELHIDSTALRLDGSTSLSFSTLDDRTVQLALTQGSLIARVRSLPPGQRFEIDTPNLAFTASQPGDYRLDVDPAAGTTRVTVHSGSAVVYGSDGASAELVAREQITFSGAGLAQVAAQTAPALDPFDRWAAARDLDEDRSISARYVSRDVIGYQQLDDYGDWDSDPTYGEVWVPRVTVVDWAPYRIGHWAWIAPWGWTWIDDEPWGFAPFHYGRWAFVRSRWCWVPGAIAVRPVYAPALVAFVGGSAGGVNFNLSVGGAFQPGVAWFPLAPGEVWHPAFRASPAYVTNVNRTVINHNVTNITNVTNVYRYQHLPAAVTAVTVAAFAQGQHVRGNARPVAAAELERARVVAPPAPTHDPRSVFGASKLTQAHPAPPAAAVERRVVANPAFNRARAGNPPVREALPPGPQLRPEPARNAQGKGSTPPRGFTPPGPANAAAPALPPAVRPPLAGVPQVPRGQREPPAPLRSEAITAPHPAAPAPPPQAVPHRSPVQQEQVQREQVQREQALRQQNAQREQAQNEQATRAAQMQAQRAQQEQQMQAQRAQQQMRQAQAQAQRAQEAQRAQQAPPMRQIQPPPRPPQEQRGAPAPEIRARPAPAGEAQRPHREEQRPAQVN